MSASRINYHERVQSDRLSRLSQKRRGQVQSVEERIFEQKHVKPARETVNETAASQRAQLRREELKRFTEESRASVIENPYSESRPHVPLSQLNPRDYIPRRRRNEGNTNRTPAQTGEELDAYQTLLFGKPVRIEVGHQREPGGVGPAGQLGGDLCAITALPVGKVDVDIGRQAFAVELDQVRIPVGIAIGLKNVPALVLALGRGRMHGAGEGAGVDPGQPGCRC